MACSGWSELPPNTSLPRGRSVMEAPAVRDKFAALQHGCARPPAEGRGAASRGAASQQAPQEALVRRVARATPKGRAFGFPPPRFLSSAHTHIHIHTHARTHARTHAHSCLPVSRRANAPSRPQSGLYLGPISAQSRPDLGQISAGAPPSPSIRIRRTSRSSGCCISRPAGERAEREPRDSREDSRETAERQSREIAEI